MSDKDDEKPVDLLSEHFKEGRLTPVPPPQKPLAPDKSEDDTSEG